MARRPARGSSDALNTRRLVRTPYAATDTRIVGAAWRTTRGNSQVRLLLPPCARWLDRRERVIPQHSRLMQVALGEFGILLVAPLGAFALVAALPLVLWRRSHSCGRPARQGVGFPCVARHTIFATQRNHLRAFNGTAGAFTVVQQSTRTWKEELMDRETLELLLLLKMAESKKKKATSR